MIEMRIGLSQKEIKKIEKILIARGKNTDKKKSEFIREAINVYDENKLFFAEKQLKNLADEFYNLVKIGGNINQLLYHINIEHIKFLNGDNNSYFLNEKEVVSQIDELKISIEILRKEILELVKIKRI
jgi:hypothetical protein